MHPDHDPFAAARAALDAAAPDTAALMAARLLAEMLRRAAGAGEARAMLDALDAPLRACEASIEAILATAGPRAPDAPAQRVAVAAGDAVVFHAPGPCGRAGPQRQGVVVETGPDGVAVALSARARIVLPHGAILRNLTRSPTQRDGDAA